MLVKPRRHGPKWPVFWLGITVLLDALLAAPASAGVFDGKRYIFDKPPVTEEVVVNRSEQPREGRSRRRHGARHERRREKPVTQAPAPAPPPVATKVAVAPTSPNLDRMPMQSAAWAKLRAPRLDTISFVPPLVAVRVPVDDGALEETHSSLPVEPGPAATAPVVEPTASSGWKLVRVLGGGVLVCFVGSMAIVMITRRRPVGRVQPWFDQGGHLAPSTTSRRPASAFARRGRWAGAYPTLPKMGAVFTRTIVNPQRRIPSDR
jgi:hypothetical protein